jgi:hypothetical protein
MRGPHAVARRACLPVRQARGMRGSHADLRPPKRLPRRRGAQRAQRERREWEDLMRWRRGIQSASSVSSAVKNHEGRRRRSLRCMASRGGAEGAENAIHRKRHRPDPSGGAKSAMCSAADQAISHFLSRMVSSEDRLQQNNQPDFFGPSSPCEAAYGTTCFP